MLNNLLDIILFEVRLSILINDHLFSEFNAFSPLDNLSSSVVDGPCETIGLVEGM